MEFIKKGKKYYNLISLDNIVMTNYGYSYRDLDSLYNNLKQHFDETDFIIMYRISENDRILFHLDYNVDEKKIIKYGRDAKDIFLCRSTVYIQFRTKDMVNMFKLIYVNHLADEVYMSA